MLDPWKGVEDAAATDPDVILLDLVTPDVGGLGVFEALRRRSRDVPIVMMSAAVADEAAGRAEAVTGGEAGSLARASVVRSAVARTPRPPRVARPLARRRAATRGPDRRSS